VREREREQEREEWRKRGGVERERRLNILR
jgi:hypothetical protein